MKQDMYPFEDVHCQFRMVINTLHGNGDYATAEVLVRCKNAAGVEISHTVETFAGKLANSSHRRKLNTPENTDSVVVEDKKVEDGVTFKYKLSEQVACQSEDSRFSEYTGNEHSSLDEEVALALGLSYYVSGSAVYVNNKVFNPSTNWNFCANLIGVDGVTELKLLPYSIPMWQATMSFPDGDVVEQGSSPQRAICSVLIASKLVGYLHDTLEDTSVTKEDVETAFGMDISDGVYLLTHLENEPYDSYLDLLMQDKTTSFVKYCDAKVNMEFSVFLGDTERINKYAEIMYTINSQYNFISWN